MAHRAFAERRRWLSEAAYAGLARGGLAGGLAARLGFALPSAIAVVSFARALPC